MQPAHTPRDCLIVLALVWLGMTPGRPERVHAEPSLANLLGGRPAEPDPTEELAQRLHALEHRPFAADASVQGALAQARAALLQLRTAYGNGASQAVVQRHTGLVWAALSAADRLQARIATAAALAGLAQRARDAEAAAERARTALAQTQQQRVAAEPVRADERAP